MWQVERHFADHDFVVHSVGEYVRGDVHTNTIEGYFSIFKRGMRGVYQHCNKKHLHRYATEFEFRYNNRIANGADDRVRADIALTGIVGKRLTYETAGVLCRRRKSRKARKISRSGFFEMSAS